MKKKEGDFLSQLDTYRNTLLKKQEDISKLNQDMAKEQAKIAPLQKKSYQPRVLSAERKASPP
ncbi:MAG: hypothetical protein PUI42_01495 [Lachnospiraceae bacterium]|nr:hypothetical protein [Lachnospiraceae bacterium]